MRNYEEYVHINRRLQGVIHRWTDRLQMQVWRGGEESTDARVVADGHADEGRWEGLLTETDQMMPLRVMLW